MDIGLTSQQLEFVLAEQQYAAFVGGIGSGKSVGGCVRGLMAAGGQIGQQRIRTPNLGVITAPTYPMLRDSTLRTFREIAGDAIADYNKEEMRATLVNGSEILFRSTEHYERLRGPSIKWWFGDEAALYPDVVWRIMVGRLRQFGEQGFAWIGTTPKGRNWVWQKFVKDFQQAVAANRHKLVKRYRLVRARTVDNTFLDAEFVESLLDEYTGDFAEQELLGEFVAFEGLIYPEFNRIAHMTHDTGDLRRFKVIIAGVDWGFTNAGVILIAGIDWDGRIVILHEEYARRRRIEDWVEVAKQLHKTFNVSAWYCDPSKPDYIQMFEEAGLSAEAANNSVETGIQAVRQRLIIRQDGLPRLHLGYGAVWLPTEFEQYQWAANKYGLKDQPLKANDHTMDTLRYLCMGVDESAGGLITVDTQRYAG